MDFIQQLNEGYLFFDGAMGSMLQKYGLKPGEGSELQNLSNPEAVISVHQQYLEAGADIITANTFGAYSLRYDNADDIIEAAANCLQKAIAGMPGKFAALDLGPTGRLLKPFGDLDFEECHATFQQAAQCGAKAGVDLILIETMTDIYELKTAVLAAKSTGLPVVATMSFDENGRSLMGSDPECMAVLLEALQVDALGMNCGYGPDVFEKLLPMLKTKLPILLQPNAGLPEMKDGQPFYSLSPEDFAQSVTRMATKGVRLFGGCCGTTPAHIRAMVEQVAPLSTLWQAPSLPLAASSATKIVRLEQPLEAYNIPCCTAVDIDDRIDEAIEFEQEGADIVEIFVDSPEDVPNIQAMVRVPLSLRADNRETLLNAVRLYCGCPLLTNVPQDVSLRASLQALGGVVQ